MHTLTPLLSEGIRRYRWDRFSRVSLYFSWGAALSLLLLLVSVFIYPGTAALAPLLLTVLLSVLGGGAIAVFYRPIPPRNLHTRMDQFAKLPDSVLTAGDWSTLAEPTAWQQIQVTETEAALRQVNWREAWPIHWPRLSWFPLATTALLAGVLMILYFRYQGAQESQLLAARVEMTPVHLQDLKTVNEVFQQWEEAQKDMPSPEMQELLRELKPLREQLEAGRVNPKQLLVELNKVQDRLQSMQAKIESASMEPMADSLADAFRPMEATGALSAALKKKDFGRAAEEAKKIAEQLKNGEAKVPSGAQASEAADKMSEMSKQAQQKKNEGMQGATQKMEQGLRKQDGEPMGKGLQELEGECKQEQGRQQQKQSLKQQMAQMGEAKNGTGQKEGISKRAMSMLGPQKSKKPGQGAGTESDPNRFGKETELNATREKVDLAGTAGEGMSEKTTEKSRQSNREVTASGVSAEQFSQYEKLSEQAAEDENMPLAHRQMIKRYFENIRPKKENSTP